VRRLDDQAGRIVAAAVTAVELDSAVVAERAHKQ
jgi:hypothetical protein